MRYKKLYALCLAATICVPAIAEAHIPPLLISSQAGDFISQMEVWDEEVTGDTISLAAVDLDMDGKMELLVSQFAGTAVSSRTKVYTFDEDGYVVPVQEAGDQDRPLPVDFYFMETVPCLHNIEEDHYIYGGVNPARFGNQTQVLFGYNHGVFWWRDIARCEPDGLYYSGDSLISEEEYEKAIDTYFETYGTDGMRKEAHFQWLTFTPSEYEAWKQGDFYEKRSGLHDSYVAFENSME